ncbi:MAG: flagellar hook protein FlgE, partial [Myxococcales bacterium]|nr:flagellar hook protein FlgE [Myxococcales bacterium]
MTITKTMNTGVSGLRTQQDALGVVGDNIANANTVGFKQSRALFEDVLANISTRQNRGIGEGARMVRAQQIFTQGALKNTDVPTDLALSGDGFFMVHGVSNGVAGDFFTRDGQFTLNREGTLVNSQGLEVLGYPAQANGSFVGPLSPIKVQQSNLAPKPTETVKLAANLDSTASGFLPGSFSPADPVSTSNFSTSLTVYDNQGASHTLDIYFMRQNDGNLVNPQPTNVWEAHVLDGTTDLTGGTPVTLQFDTDGTLLSQSAPIQFNVAYPNAGTQNIKFDVGDPTSTGGTGLLGISQFGAASSMSIQTQNGYAAGNLTGISVTADGDVTGAFSNGQTLPIAKVAVAKFQSNGGLGRIGYNLWAKTPESGEPAVGSANTGGRGAVVAGAVEQSNVDLATQFVDMIGFQRV